MSVYVASNRARSTLAAALTASVGDVTLQVDPADAALFPAINNSGLTSDQFTVLTLFDASGNYEEVRVTRHDTGSSSFTIERGQENTEIRAWQIGDSVTLRMTSGVIEELFASGYRCLVSATQPSNPGQGTFWFDPVTGKLWIRYVDESGAGQWVAPGAVQLIGDGTITSAKLDQGGVALPDGSTATTQSSDDASAKVATDAFVQAVVSEALAALSVPDASTEAPGIAELADEAETKAGTDTARVVTPAGLAAARTVVVDSFDTAGGHTWNKPDHGTMAMIEVWAGGGSGARGTYASGGGGGGYSKRLMRLSDLPASVAVTVGAGGASRTTNSNGANGGDSSFGAYLKALGGPGGVYSLAAGAQFQAVGGQANEQPGGLSGAVVGTPDGNGGYLYYPSAITVGESTWDAGCGGGAACAYGVNAGATKTSSGGTPNGQGGAGGNGAVSAAATAGTAPGGAGGGAYNGNSGAGAAGRVKITVF